MDECACKHMLSVKLLMHTHTHTHVQYTKGCCGYTVHQYAYIHRTYSAFSMETILAFVFGRVVNIQRGETDQFTEACESHSSSLLEGQEYADWMVVLLSKWERERKEESEEGENRETIFHVKRVGSTHCMVKEATVKFSCAHQGIL